MSSKYHDEAAVHLALLLMSQISAEALSLADPLLQFINTPATAIS
jgi:hypothetical protein